MNRVNGVTGSVAAVGSRAKAAVGPGAEFSVASSSPAENAQGVQEVPPVGLAGMLALQEAEAEIAGNRQGKRHGFALLEALQELQRGLLNPGREWEVQAAGLSRLAGRAPAVMDPKLADILSAIRLRAKIELLRRGVETG